MQPINIPQFVSSVCGNGAVEFQLTMSSTKVTVKSSDNVTLTGPMSGGVYLGEGHDVSKLKTGVTYKVSMTDGVISNIEALTPATETKSEGDGSKSSTRNGCSSNPRFAADRKL